MSGNFYGPIDTRNHRSPTSYAPDTISNESQRENLIHMGRTLRRRPFASGLVYLSGPILGSTYEEARYGWRQTVAEGLLPGIRPLSPMRHEGHLAEHTGVIGDDAIDAPSHFFAGAKIIVEKDMLDIRKSDLVLVYLIGATKVSIGTMVEMGMARMMDKTIITVIDEGNIHAHPFVTETSSLVLDNLDDAIYAINSLLSTGV